MYLMGSGISLFLRLSRNECATFSSVVCVVFSFCQGSATINIYIHEMFVSDFYKINNLQQCYRMVSGFPERLDQSILTQSELKS